MSDPPLQNVDDAVTALRTTLGNRLLKLVRPSESRVYIDVEAESVTDVAQAMSEEVHARLQTVSAVDGPKRIEILYHWAMDSLGLVITIRTQIDRQASEIASITGVCPAAEWIEREMWELMGIKFRGHPDLRHLLLEDDWPEGQFPLRRDYERE